AVIAKMGLAACFEPARSSIIPSLCTREELVAANAISGATWSAMLALGAALGGLVAGTLGVTAAFLLDSLSFALSAALIATVRVDERGTKDTDPRGGKLEPSGEHAPQVFYHEAHEAHEGRTAADYAPCPAKTPVQPNVRPSSTLVHQVVDELREGLTYVFAHRELAWLTFNKAIWSLGGGVLLLLTLFGREVFPIGRDGAISIGLLYAARGVGAGLGPLLALRLGGNGDTFLRRAVGGAFLITGLGYAALSSTRSLPLAALAVLFAHIGGSIQWVFSTALLQTRVPDRLRGRVFATEYAALTLTTGLSAYATGLVRDAGVAPWALALGLAGIFGAAGALMLVVLWRGQGERA
ncbi:MAG: MFS transporter, partial [Chloroflexales bacterium]